MTCQFWYCKMSDFGQSLRQCVRAANKAKDKRCGGEVWASCFLSVAAGQSAVTLDSCVAKQSLEESNYCTRQWQRVFWDILVADSADMIYSVWKTDRLVYRLVHLTLMDEAAELNITGSRASQTAQDPGSKLTKSSAAITSTFIIW